MPWCRIGDTSAFHPLLLNVLEHPECDDRVLNEAFGFFMRCATQSAAHLTDYIVTRGTALSIAGGRGTHLIEVCLFAGLMEEVDVDGDGSVIAYKLVDSDPEFLHLRRRQEVEWERQRKLDAQRPSLIVPVRLRDGDACRWCGRIVDWNDRKSGRAGTYDHMEPGEPATVDTYVVACKECNSSRRDGDFPTGIDAIMPPPETPLFSAGTVRWLTENKWRIEQGLRVPAPTPADTLRSIARVTGNRSARTTSQSSPQPAGDSSGRSAPSATQTSGAAPSANRGSTPQPSPQPAGGSSGRSAPSATPTSGRSAPSATQEERGDAPSAIPDRTSTVADVPAAPTIGDQAASCAGPNGHPQAPTGGPGNAAGPPAPPPPAQTPIKQISARYQAEKVDRHGTGSDSSGRVGSGRVGPGLVGGPLSATSETPASPHDSPRRRRGGRGRRPIPPRKAL